MGTLDILKERRSAHATVDAESVRSAYRRYVGIYDLVFGAVLEPGRKAAVRAINTRPHQRILEVGVGTGLSLPAYSRHARVTGIDLSSDMLARARRRVDRRGLPQIEALLEMDAEDMSFPEQSFDTVVAMYVLTVVPHPERLLSEMRRVCAPGGEIAIVNHFASTHPIIRSAERSLTRFAATLGFRSNLERTALEAYADLPIIETRRINIFGYSTLIRFRNQPIGA